MEDNKDILEYKDLDEVAGGSSNWSPEDNERYRRALVRYGYIEKKFKNGEAGREELEAAKKEYFAVKDEIRLKYGD